MRISDWSSDVCSSDLQQLIGLIKSHAEGDSDRFFDLAMQLSAAEEQKGHKRLAEQLRQWAEAGQTAPSARIPSPTPIAAPRGDLAQFLAASYQLGRATCRERRGQCV